MLKEKRSYNERTLKYYENHAGEYFERTISLDMTRCYELFMKYSKPPCKVLDAGSGSGRDTKYLRSLGFDVVSLDGCLELAKISTDYTGEPTLYMNLNDISFQQEFDRLWTAAVLVHFQEDHLLEVMERLKCALKPNGMWLMSFKYGECSKFVDERFFYNVTESSLQKLILNLHGLELVEYYLQCEKEEIVWINAMVRKHA